MRQYVPENDLLFLAMPSDSPCESVLGWQWKGKKKRMRRERSLTVDVILSQCPLSTAPHSLNP